MRRVLPALLAVLLLAGCQVQKSAQEAEPVLVYTDWNTTTWKRDGRTTYGAVSETNGANGEPLFAFFVPVSDNGCKIQQPFLVIKSESPSKATGQTPTSVIVRVDELAPETVAGTHDEKAGSDFQYVFLPGLLDNQALQTQTLQGQSVRFTLKLGGKEHVLRFGLRSFPRALDTIRENCREAAHFATGSKTAPAGTVRQSPAAGPAKQPADDSDDRRFFKN